MGKMAKKTEVEADCMSLAYERTEFLFDTFDQILVSFSGGKDSTACLNIALEVATAKKKLPLRVVTFDEEAIPPETVEYCQRVSERDDVAFEWYCIPIQHRNACSKKQPYWYCWAPEDRHLWCRDLPPTAITKPIIEKRAGIPDYAPHLFDPRKGSAACIMGIRGQESMTRLNAVLSKRGSRAFIMNPEQGSFISKAYPIYDWAHEDVWLAPDLKGWDYNHAYDIMALAGMPLGQQRCCPPYGEQPLRGLWRFKICWPELWSKMVNRVHGAATAARYANTAIYGVGVKNADLPSGCNSWREATLAVIQKLTPDSRAEVANAIKSCMRNHAVYTDDAVPDEVQHPESGYSWKLFYGVAKIGGDKFGRQQQKINLKAIAVRAKNGIRGPQDARKNKSGTVKSTEPADQ